MTERYGNCRWCYGTGYYVLIHDSEKKRECDRCDGTGFSADQALMDQKESDRDWDDEQRVNPYD